MTVALLLVFSAPACGPAADEDGRLKIAGMFMQEDQFFRLVRFGMQQAAKEEGAELLLSTVDGKPEKELQLVNTYIARQVDGIVLSPLSATASVTALRRAHDAGIHVVAYNSTVEGGLPAAFIESDQSDLGSQTGEAARTYIEEKLGGQAQIAILAFKSALTEQSEARTNGFKSRVTDLPGVEIVAEQDAWLPEMGIRKAGDILTANPGIDLIWCANEGGTVGAVMAVKSAGRGGEVVVFGTDVSDQMLGFLLAEDEILQAVTGQKPFEIGYQSVKAAVAVIQGREVESHVSMSGVLLERRDLEIVRAYRARLQELIAN
ncbi:MAG: substrate-binding domain-containing protein [Acidobacteriota bacterium]|nr:substrate-binding domain-containing protein [Acidobacteriota bacterium]